ncbi:MAG: HU family DNA-binding protein [Candidatus Kurthia intestinigallinarum]
MERVIKKPELIDILAEKTGFYKCNMKVVVDALADIVIENLQTATFEQDSEFHLAPGVVIMGKRVPEREAKDPRTGGMVMSPEKVIPRAVFKPSVRLKLYKKPKGYKKKGKRV